MDVSDKVKEEVKRILCSKNLFYEEMCSYHTGNRLHLCHDPKVQRSLQLALRSRDKNEPNQSKQRKGDDDFDEEHLVAGADDYIEETEENRGIPRWVQEQWMAFRLLQLKEQKLQIQVQKHELEKQCFNWRMINWNKESDLDKMRLENECMKIENER
ncbi:hypothetical protein REPUB_Repub04eG0028600 [Reevesia pubescens]